MDVQLKTDNSGYVIVRADGRYWCGPTLANWSTDIKNAQTFATKGDVQFQMYVVYGDVASEMGLKEEWRE